MEEDIAGQARTHRQQHDLHDRQRHRPGRHLHVGAGQPQGQQRGDDGGKHRGKGGHRHRKRRVALGQVAHHVRRRPSGHAADEDDAHLELGGQRQQVRHAPTHQRHDRVLAEHTQNDRLRVTSDHREVRDGQGHPHSKHRDGQQRRHVAGQRHEGGGREEGGEESAEHDEREDRHRNAGAAVLSLLGGCIGDCVSVCRGCHGMPRINGGASAGIRAVTIVRGMKRCRLSPPCGRT